MSKSTIAIVSVLIAVKIAVHAALISRYGWHGDEFYFVECGRRLAFGYVDHAPMIGWIARASEALGGGLIALRIPAIAAGAATMWFVALLVRQWGGGAVAAGLALAACLFAPAFLRMGAMLDIPVIEVAVGAGASYLIVRAIERNQPKTWLAVGAVVGIGLLVKHSLLLWLLALGAGLLLSAERRVLGTRWPWLGLAIALLIFTPNLIWQAQNDFATLEFLRNLRQNVVDQQGRGLFVAGQLLYFHPLAVPIWGAAFATRVASAKPFVGLFAVLFALLLATGGKPYYLGIAYPAMFAAGAVVLERWFAERRRALAGYAGAFALTGVSFGVITLPVMSIKTTDAVLGRLFGWIVAPILLTQDLHGMLGWDEHTETVARVHASLPAPDRQKAFVLTGSYAQAGALNVLDTDERVPPAASGHMTYYLWGPPPDRGDVLIAYAVPRAFLERNYASVTEVDRIVAPLARPFDDDQRVYVCREPKRPVREWWPELKRYGHRGPQNTEP